MLDQSKKELEFAISSLDSCKKAKDLNEYEKHWLNFLGHIEKLWKKSERECQPFKNKFQPWQGKFIKLRRTDQLLKYIKNCRDVDNHLIESVVEKTNSKTTLNPADRSKPHFIKNLKIGKEGFEYEGDPMEINFTPASIKCLPVKNSGVEYNVPQKHLKRKLSHPDNPIFIGELGIKFYKDYLTQIENKFKKN